MAIKTNLKSMVPRRQAFKKLITLPSHGFSNPIAWPDGQIYVYPWDSEVDEFLLAAARKSGPQQNVLFSLVANLCDLNGGKLDEFVADEANIILLVARSIVQEGTVEYVSICPFCNTKSPEKIKVPDELEKLQRSPPIIPASTCSRYPTAKMCSEYARCSLRTNA